MKNSTQYKLMMNEQEIASGDFQAVWKTMLEKYGKLTLDSLTKCGIRMESV